jgi:hypothetical protein
MMAERNAEQATMAEHNGESQATPSDNVTRGRNRLMFEFVDNVVA